MGQTFAGKNRITAWTGLGALYGVGVSYRKFRDRFVEFPVIPDIARQSHCIAGARVGPCQGAAAERGQGAAAGSAEAAGLAAGEAPGAEARSQDIRPDSECAVKGV